MGESAPQAVSQQDMERSFAEAVWGADRVIVERKNALGEYDSEVFQAATVRGAIRWAYRDIEAEAAELENHSREASSGD